MIRRIGGVLVARDPESAPEESRQLQQAGFAVLPEVLAPDEVMSLKTPSSMCSSAIRLTTERPSLPKMRRISGIVVESFRSSSSLHCQSAGVERHRASLGEDCHIIANTAWNNPPAPGSEGQAWHVDGGPHIPLPKGVRWPTELPGQCLQSVCTIY